MVHQQVFGNSTTKDVTKLTFSDLHDAIEMRDFSRQEMDAGIEKGFQSHRIKAGGSRHVPQIASLVSHLREIEAIPRIHTEDVGGSWTVFAFQGSIGILCN